MRTSQPIATSDPAILKGVETFSLPVEAIISGMPSAGASVLFRSPDGATTAGVFSCTVGAFYHTFTAREFMLIHSGHLRLEFADGSDRELRAGDTIEIQPGTRVLFDVRERLIDFYLSWSPSPASRPATHTP